MSIFDESVQLLETPWSAPVEDLYQAFKERLMRELSIGEPVISGYRRLVDIPPIDRDDE